MDVPSISVFNPTLPPVAGSTPVGVGNLPVTSGGVPTGRMISLLA